MTTPDENLCVTCKKQNTITICKGCLQNFCYKDFGNHREELNKELDDIELNHDLLRQSFVEQTVESEKHSLIQKIDQWECESIKKIKQIAEETRIQILNYKNKHINRIELKLNNLTDRLRQSREENDFVETNLNEWNKQLIELKEELNKPSNVILEYDSIPLVTKIYVGVYAQISVANIAINARWIQNGITVAGGNGWGNGLNQLFWPSGIYVYDNQTIYVADRPNHRIMEWKTSATSGQVVAGGNGAGIRNDQLNYPTNVIVDKQNDCLFICDRTNKRIVRWPRQNGTSGETIISNICCWDLTIDNEGYLYVSDVCKHEVRRYKIGDTNGIVVAGGNGQGNRLDQLSQPYYIFVDQDRSVYVSEYGNHRVMKWMKDATEGIVVAGGHDQGNSLTQLAGPYGVIVDQLETVYVADYNNHRVLRWLKGATQGSVVVGGNGSGGQSNQLNGPIGLSLDRQNNLYVVDNNNHRVQKFNIE